MKVGITGGNPYGDSTPLSYDTGWIQLTREWRRYELPLDGAVNHVISPFVLITNRAHNPAGKALIYLDEIYFVTDAKSADKPRKVLPAPEDFAFFRYLTAGKPTPALVAFNAAFHPWRPPGVLPYPEVELRQDLASCARHSTGSVLYSYRGDRTPGIVKAAAELGYRAVLLGLWDLKDEAEFTGIAQLIEAWHEKLALGLIVGNEGIIDNRYTYDDLDAAVRRLKALLPASARVPVATSEPIGDYGSSGCAALATSLPLTSIQPSIRRRSIPAPRRAGSASKPPCWPASPESRC